MEENSNKTILALIAIALAISIAGTIISVNKIGNLGGKYSALSGAATTTSGGTGSMLVQSSTAIKSQQTSVQFGSWAVNATCDFCVLNSTPVSGTRGNAMPECCMPQGGTSLPGVWDPQSFLIENIGTTNVSLNFTCAGNCTAATFIGGTSPQFKFRILENSVLQQADETTATVDTLASCPTSMITNGAFTNMLTSAWICGTGHNAGNQTFTPNFEKDAIALQLHIQIPDDASPDTTARAATFTFNAFTQG